MIAMESGACSKGNKKPGAPQRPDRERIDWVAVKSVRPSFARLSLSRSEHGLAVVVLGSWLILYVWRAVSGHYSLATNAFDLSVFDYSLWNTLRGKWGFVPFLGHSIFSHHFMPVLLLLAPVYALVQSPVFLITLQEGSVAAGGWLFYRFERRIGLDRAVSLILLVVFLTTRRMHSAALSVFYPECFEAVLTFAVVAAWTRSARVFWPTAVLLLMTKEDAALYLAAFAAVQFFIGPVDARRRAAGALALSIAWAVVAFGVAIPASRAMEGLATSNPLLESRYGTDPHTLPIAAFASRLLSLRTLRTLFDLAAATGFLVVLAPATIAPAVPGVLANVAANQDSMQATMIGHYAWAVLPWLFMAAAAGALRLQARSMRWTRVWCALLLAGTLVDSRAAQSFPRTHADAQARIILHQLADITSGDDYLNHVILAQPNLIPHLRHSDHIFALKGDYHPPSDPDWILLTRTGDLWPLQPDELDGLVAQFAADPAYEQRLAGPLFAFRLRRGH